MDMINLLKRYNIVLVILTIGLLLFISGCVESPKENITPMPTAPPNTPPKAAASASPSSIYEGDVVSFNGLSSIDPDGSISSYQWNFGDGEIGTGATVTHKYSSSGTYTVLLTVVDNGGLRDTDSVKITVNPKPTSTPIIQPIATPIIQSTPSKITSGDKVVKIIDFIPRQGEKIADLLLDREMLRSGSDKNLSIDYYPENIIVWSSDFVIEGKRFLNSEDAQKYFTYYYKGNPILIESWDGVSYQKQLSGEYKGTWYTIVIKHEPYVLRIGINGDKVPMAQEKAEIVAKILIDRFNAALW